MPAKVGASSSSSLALSIGDVKMGPLPAVLREEEDLNQSSEAWQV